MSKATSYAKLAAFIQAQIIEAGYRKSNGDPNISAFYDKYALLLAKTSFKIGKSSFSEIANNRSGGRVGTQRLEAIAYMLATATRTEITVALLDSLIVRPDLTRVNDKAEQEADLPDDQEAEIVMARRVFVSLKSLEINARKTISPEILELLARDWRYLGASEPMRIAQCLQAQLYALNMSIANFAKKRLNGLVSVEQLTAIYNGESPNPPLDREQFLLLRDNIKSIDGNTLTLEELYAIAPHLDSSKRDATP
ncbi:MAG: hypothetical protein RLZZ511_1016 [Cyanobacteriota bacterium]